MDASARRVRHYRYAEERLARTMAGWIALTPELPAKLLLGRHVWDCAQHADLWGRRLPELRSPAQRSEPANDRVVRFMELIEKPDGPDETVERLVGVYRVLKPHLLATYEHHLAHANPVYEPPTRRILERTIADERRHISAGDSVLERLITAGGGEERADRRESQLLQALGEAGGVCGDGNVLRVIVDASTDPASDVVGSSPFDAARVDAGLRATIEAAVRAAAVRDASALARLAVPEAATALVDCCAGAADAVHVIACARVGAYRIVKVRLVGSRGSLILQMQCRPSDDGWQVADARRVGEFPAP